MKIDTLRNQGMRANYYVRLSASYFIQRLFFLRGVEGADK